MNSFTNEINKNRQFSFTVSLPVAVKEKEVSVELKKHKFSFGCNGFGFIDGILNEREQNIYKTKFLELFNAATLPFYWGRYEQTEGQTQEKAMLGAAKWAVNNNITLKGHPLCWHTVCADWLLHYPTKEIYTKQMKRIERDVKVFKGLIDTWDVINEVVILPDFNRYDNAVSRMAKEYGAENLAYNCFVEAKKHNPQSILLLNDFNLSPKYEELLERLLERGCPIDAIGLQTHQHQGYLGVDYIEDVLKRFSKFNLPLHFTEMTLLSGDLAPSHFEDLNDAARDYWPSTQDGEERQVKEVTEIYSKLYSNPLVESIVWWDMVDGNWLNAPSGLLRKNLTPKPAFNALSELINRDWGYELTNHPVTENRKIVFTGPEGTYSIKMGDKEYLLEFSKTNKSESLT